MGDATVQVEVWGLAADQEAIWLVTGENGPWTPTLPMPADSSPHHEVDMLLRKHVGVSVDELPYVHSPSWRPTMPRIVLTYVAVIDCPGPVIEHWPLACPIGQPLADHVGKPPRHASNQAPKPRTLDVVFHALRHIAHQIRASDEAARDLNHWWHVHTDDLWPTLAGLYRDDDAGQAA